MGGLIYGITKKINEKIYKDSDFQYKKKFKKYLLIASLITYIIFNIIWIIVVRPPVVGDQIHICNLAQTFYRLLPVGKLSPANMQQSAAYWNQIPHGFPQ